MSWADTPIHFIDFEGNAMSGILEFGAVTLHGGKVVAAHTRLCRATGWITPEETAVHGLKVDTLLTQAFFASEWERFATMRENGPFAAHFASVEHSLLRRIWPYPRQVPDFARPGQAAADWGPWIDTGRLYPQLFPQWGSYRLQDLVTRGGFQAELDALALTYCPPERRHYHAALYDALAGSVLLLGLLRRAELAEATIPWLLQMSISDGEKRSELQQGSLF